MSKAINISRAIPMSWHQAFYQHISERYRLGSLPHAVLVYGEEGIGKAQAVNNVAQSLLCQRVVGAEACGECQPCQLYQGFNHPNFTRLAPEKNDEKKTQSPIKIDQIRDLSSKLVMTSQYEGPNIAVIEQADMMNHFAANSLLKTLEEPTSNTIIFLITSQLSKLLPTIRSRCQSYSLKKASADEAIEWLKEQQLDASDKEYLQALQIAGGAPLTALAILENDVIAQRLSLIESILSLLNNQSTIAQVVELTLKMDFLQSLSFVQNFLADVIRLHQTADKMSIVNVDLAKFIKQLSAKVTPRDAYLLLDELNTMLKNYNASINTQLMLESFFASWHNMLTNNTKTA